MRSCTLLPLLALAATTLAAPTPQLGTSNAGDDKGYGSHQGVVERQTTPDVAKLVRSVKSESQDPAALLTGIGSRQVLSDVNPSTVTKDTKILNTLLGRANIARSLPSVPITPAVAPPSIPAVSSTGGLPSDSLLQRFGLPVKERQVPPPPAPPAFPAPSAAPGLGGLPLPPLQPVAGFPIKERQIPPPPSPPLPAPSTSPTQSPASSGNPGLPTPTSPPAVPAAPADPCLDALPTNGLTKGLGAPVK